MPNLVALGQTV